MTNIFGKTFTESMFVKFGGPAGGPAPGKVLRPYGRAKLNQVIYLFLLKRIAQTNAHVKFQLFIRHREIEFVTFRQATLKLIIFEAVQVVHSGFI